MEKLAALTQGSFHRIARAKEDYYDGVWRCEIRSKFRGLESGNAPLDQKGGLFLNKVSCKWNNTLFVSSWFFKKKSFSKMTVFLNMGK